VIVTTEDALVLKQNSGSSPSAAHRLAWDKQYGADAFLQDYVNKMTTGPFSCGQAAPAARFTGRTGTFSF
jgi:hypothetical protein